MSVCCQIGLNLLFPPRCTYCEAELSDLADGLLLCDECRGVLGPKQWACCQRCGAPVAAGEAADRCERCRAVGLRFDTAVSLGPYQDHLRAAVLRMKRPAGRALARAMGRLFLARRGARIAPLGLSLVVPIPMHWRRRWSQGVNSPEILADCLAEHLHVPAERVLWRQRNTIPQANLPPKRRFANVRGAFGLRSGYDLQGTHVLLVDDILTTGATCSEAARVLKTAGVAQVAVAVLARALGEHVLP